MKRTVVSLLFFFVLASALSANAEFYVGGQVGFNAPRDLTDIQGTGAATGITLSDLDLENGVVFGGKFGGYFANSLNWLGGELEVYHTNSNIKQQQATISAPILGLSVSGTLPAADLAITTVAFNILVRYPHETWQPYAGIGGGINVARLSGGTTVSETAYLPSVNFLAGLKFFVTQHIAIFGEYKFNYGSSWEFEDNLMEVDYSTNMFLGGASYHFDLNLI